MKNKAAYHSYDYVYQLKRANFYSFKINIIMQKVKFYYFFNNQIL